MRASRSDGGDVGLRLAADFGSDGARHRRGDTLRIGLVATERKQRRSRSREAAPERASLDGRPLDRRESGYERRTTRLGNPILERSPNLGEVAAMKSVDERDRKSVV